MTEPTHDTDFMLPAEAVRAFLEDDRVFVSRHYYAAGDIDVSPVVLRLERVSEDIYSGLAKGELEDQMHYEWKDGEVE